MGGRTGYWPCMAVPNNEAAAPAPEIKREMNPQ
jgi:hypothetical protein